MKPILNVFLLAGFLLAVLFIAAPQVGFAQTSSLTSMTGGSAESETDALNTLIDGAKAEGSTVIVIAP
ncbi:MAG: hypothetical protein GY789_07430 [Hyphomicrobiales bacterium]|nr:hypothetical protein [Hyphomicrobiales bacterium]